MSSSRCKALFQSARVRRLLKYASVSAITTTTSLVILGILVGVFDVSAVWANFIATTLGTVPSFELNRRWVWKSSSRRPTLRQVVPFCSLSAAGLILSSLSVHVASTVTTHSSRSVHAIAIELANVGAYGFLWILQFIVCDKLLFRGSRHDAPGEDSEESYSADDSLRIDVTANRESELISS